MISAFVTYRFDGYHRWPDAPPSRAYLADTHRHRFHVRAEVDLKHDDREIEFHDLLDVVADACVALGGDSGYPTGLDLGTKSCEQMAKEIADTVRERWPMRRTRVEVSEDGDCGAIWMIP